MRKAIYPGSFDPMHKGHLKIIEKAAKLFDVVYVIVSHNPEKDNANNMDERLFEAKKLIDFPNVEVLANKDRLSVDVAKELGADWIVRSGRENVDFKYELELAAANKYLNTHIETILIMPELKDINFKSRLMKQGVK